jgi:hypothetical protein
MAEDVVVAFTLVWTGGLATKLYGVRPAVDETRGGGESRAGEEKDIGEFTGFVGGSS